MSEMALRSFDVNIIVPPKAVYHGAIGEMGNFFSVHGTYMSSCHHFI